MRRRSRTRRVLKWVGTTLCMMIVAAWIASGAYWIHVETGDWLTSLGDGSLRFVRGLPATPPEVERQFDIGRRIGSHLRVGSTPWTFPSLRSWPTAKKMGYLLVIFLPLWVPLVLVGVPSAILWWSDRRTPKGHCRSCDYDLTGNVSGICPECGTPVPDARTPRASGR